MNRAADREVCNLLARPFDRAVLDGIIEWVPQESTGQQFLDVGNATPAVQREGTPEGASRFKQGKGAAHSRQQRIVERVQSQEAHESL